MAGSLPRLPQRLMVRGETRRSSATSLTVSKSGRLLRSKSPPFFLDELFCDIMLLLGRLLSYFDYGYNLAKYLGVCQFGSAAANFKFLKCELYYVWVCLYFLQFIFVNEFCISYTVMYIL